MRFLILLVLPALVGCNLDPKPLLQNYQDGEFVPADVVDLDLDEAPPELDDAEPYIGNLGPSDVGGGRISGATRTIRGTGGRMCVIVDPQSVFRDDLQLAGDNNEYWNPFMDDFPYDDGDIDLQVGLAAFYTGTPGVELGDFFGSFPDSNGVDRAVDLNLCLMNDYHGIAGGTAGRGTPEFCSFETQEDVDYRIVLSVFSVPIDDDELTYALRISSGPCPGNINECTLRGDFDYREGLEDVLPDNFATVEHLYCDGLE